MNFGETTHSKTTPTAGGTYDPAAGVSNLFKLAASNRPENLLALSALAHSGLPTGVNLGVFGLTQAALAEKLANEKDEEEKERRYTLRLLEGINARIAQLEAEMEDLAENLKDQYGEDFIGGMAAKYLDPEEAENAKTEDERLALLYAKMYTPDGHVKPEYAGTSQAAYVGKAHERKEKIELAQEVNAAKGQLSPALEHKVEKSLEHSNVNQRHALTEVVKNQEVHNKAASVSDSQYNKSNLVISQL